MSATKPTLSELEASILVKIGLTGQVQSEGRTAAVRLLHLGLVEEGPTASP